MGKDRVGKRIIIIGAGFSSLSAACYLSKQGYDVVVLEKNKQVGGRARQLRRDGFTFDMGPTFYWMPDVFEAFFADFNRSVSDYYQLEKLNPAYQVHFGLEQSISIADEFEKIKRTFETIEEGSAQKLTQFIANAEENYTIAIQDLVYMPGESLFEILNLQTAKRLGLFFKSIKSQVAEHFANPQLQRIMEFPVLFLGAKPSNTPAFYNFMNYADFALGTWHPMGGMYKVVEALVSLAKSLGARIECNTAVRSILTKDGRVTGVETDAGEIDCDILLSGADYAHTETLLPEKDRQYSSQYWERKTFAPSALLFYVGFDTKLKNVAHHTLFFDADFDQHSKMIYDVPQWPENPLFYASFPSVTDTTLSPDGKELGVFLMPIAPGLTDTPEIRADYYDLIMRRIEQLTKQEIRKHVMFYESYSVNDFIADYHSYKGNAYGLANTLTQTHVLRPKLKSKKVRNLYFTGQLTVPGPGVPPSLISGKIVSELIGKYE